MTGLTGERSLTIVFLCNQAVIKTVVLYKYLKFLLFQLGLLQWYFVDVLTLDLFLMCKNILTACALRLVHLLNMDISIYFLLAPRMLALGLYWKYACSESRLGVLENRPNRFIECRSCTIVNSHFLGIMLVSWKIWK